MADPVEDIFSNLTRTYGITEYFYPNISMETDFPSGLKGEISDIIKMLKKNGLEANTNNVLRTMELKKKLLAEYSLTPQGKKKVEDYRKVLLEEIKPVGMTLPIDFVFVNGIMLVFLYAIGRFLGSFADESGKIVARRLLQDNKEKSKELDIDIREYNLLANEAAILVENKKLITCFEKKRKKATTQKRRHRAN